MAKKKKIPIEKILIWIGIAIIIIIGLRIFGVF